MIFVFRSRYELTNFQVHTYTIYPVAETTVIDVLHEHDLALKVHLNPESILNHFERDDAKVDMKEPHICLEVE